MLKKPTKKKKPVYKTASEKRHSAAVHKMECIVLEAPVIVIEHHCFTGGGGRKNHFKTIPLAPWLHTEPDRRKWHGLYPALHENRKLFAEKHGTEKELLLKTYEKLDALGKLEPKARAEWEGMR